MRKQVYIYSIFSIFLIPPMFPSASSLGRKFPDMAKGFKKCSFDKCERQNERLPDIKKPINPRNIEHSGWWLGQGMGLAYDAFVIYLASRAVTEITKQPTHPIQEWKAEGGVKGVIASATEEALDKGIPLLIGGASITSDLAKAQFFAACPKGTPSLALANAFGANRIGEATASFVKGPLMTPGQVSATAFMTPVMLKHSMAYYGTAKGALIMQNMSSAGAAIMAAPGLSNPEIAQTAIAGAAVGAKTVWSTHTLVRALFVKAGEAIWFLP